MKSLVCSMLVLCAAGLLALGGSSPAAPTPSFASVEPTPAPLIQHCDNPLCDCPTCTCTNCTCGTVEVAPVGPPPDQVALVDIKAGEITPLAVPKFTEPPPGLIVVPVAHPTPKPVAKADPVATGRWVTQQSCGRGGCSLQRVWVPNAQAAPVYQQSQSACANGSCGVRRGLFGRRR